MKDGEGRDRGSNPQEKKRDPGTWGDDSVGRVHALELHLCPCDPSPGQGETAGSLQLSG